MKNLEEFVLDVNNNIYEGRTFTYMGKGGKKIKWTLDEPEDDDAEEGIDVNSEENTVAMQDLIDKFDVEEPFFIRGRAGWGKTSTIKKLAKQNGKKVLTIYLDKAEAVDLGGIPVPVNGKTKIVANARDITGKKKQTEFAKQIKALPPWAAEMLENPDQEYLLFFDEMNQAAPDVMNALMPIVLDNVICEIEFDNFFVGAAGNFKSENNALYELSDPLASRFKPLIEWEAGTEKSWGQVFKYLHKKWDKELGKDLVNKFEECAQCFDNPREVEHKIFQFMYRKKLKGNKMSGERCLHRLEQLSIEDLTRTQSKNLSMLADKMSAYISGESEEDAKDEGRKSRKDANMISQTFIDYIKMAMKNGYVQIPVNGEDVKFGISKETVGEFVDYEECNAEMLERTINRLEAEGNKWKYETPQDWKKLSLEDPMDDKWHFKITSKTKFVKDTPKQNKPKQKKYND